MPSERVQRQIDRLLDEAEASSAVRDWATVREKAEHALTFDPQNEDAAALLRAAERGLGETPIPDANARPAVAAQPLPASFASGRYAVRSFLGEGGRKRVYLAHDTRLDRDVALAVIKTDGLDIAGLARVRNEAQAMARLGDQPNIVTVFDVADEGPSPGSGQAPQPFIVSQYMAGGSVEELIAAAKDHRLPLEQTLSIASQVCHALEHAHRQGIVHRDLKPGNIWLSADPSTGSGQAVAKLGDFGLAVALDRSRVTMAGTMLGTAAYMPPEQALGGESTPKADLYSLGCMLYEMVTGRPPFLGEDPTAVISQHINTPPVAPSWLTDRCPPELEDVILHLLAKAPADRPASAAEVREALLKVDPEKKSQSHSDSTENPLDRLARRVFVGRQLELDKLRKAFDEAFAGRGGLVMLVGEPGIGKTRTCQELETYALMRGAQVLWGRANEAGGAPPYWPWYQVGNAYPDLTAIGPLLPPGATAELSRIFTWLRQGPIFVEPEPIADPESAQFQLFEAYAAFLRAMAAQGPLLITLDDLHWADKASLLLLQHLARELSRLRVLVIGNYRDTDLSRTHPLSEALAGLNRDPGFTRIALRGLTQPEVASYIRATANVEPRPEVARRIFEETEGNPFFLSEVVSLMAQEGTLTSESISDIRIPDGVKEALGRRLDRVSEEANELLQTCAVVGREFTYDTLTLLGDRGEDALLKLVEEALKARVIEEMEQPSRYRFTHALMQETLLGELSTTRRVRLHGQVGEALEQRWGDLARERPARLARHFLESSTLTPRHAEKAAFYSALAGRQAMEQAAYADAVHHFRAALAAREGQQMDDEMAGIFFELGKACVVTIEYLEAWRAFRQAFAQYTSTGNVSGAVNVAEYAGSNPNIPRADSTAMVERALELVEEGSAEYGRLNAALGSSSGLGGDDARAQEAFERAREVALKLGLPGLELDTLGLEASVDAFHLREAAAAAKAERAVELARQLHEPLKEVNGHFYACWGLLLSGNLAPASRHGEQGLALAERLRHWSRTVSLAYAQATCATWAGDWERARALLARGLELNPADGRLLSSVALVDLLAGDGNAAGQDFDRLIDASKSWRRGPTAHFVMFASALLSSRYLGGPVRDDALARDAADAVLGSATAAPLIASGARVALALDAAMRGDRDTAEDLLASLSPLSGLSAFGFAFDHVKGLLLQTLGKPDDAVDAIESALALLSAGYSPLYAWVAFDCARIRIERGAAGDLERTRALIDESLNIAQELGMRPLVERVLRLKLQAQADVAADMTTSIDAVASVVEAERPDVSLHAAADGSVTIMFEDIADSTPITERLGDEAWVEVIRRHNVIVREQVRTHGGREVVNRGDGFMVVFSSPRAAVDCAIAIQKAFAAHTSAHEHEPIEVHIGLHSGHPAQDEGNFYGTDVNLAARIGDHVAQAGQIFVSGRLHEALRRSRSLRFDEGREVELKGLSGKQRVYEVVWD